MTLPAKNNPLPWTEHWISSKGLQVAPQETEVESYIVGGIKQDVKKTPLQVSPSEEYEAFREEAFKSITEKQQLLMLICLVTTMDMKHLRERTKVLSFFINILIGKVSSSDEVVQEFYN